MYVQMAKMSKSQKATSKQATGTLADVAKVSKFVETLSTQLSGRLDQIHAHQATLRAKAHKVTLEAAIARVDAMHGSLSDAVAAQVESAGALATAQAEVRFVTVLVGWHCSHVLHVSHVENVLTWVRYASHGPNARLTG